MVALLENSEMTAKFNEEQERVKIWKDCHDFAMRSWAPFLEEAQKDLQCYLGDQWNHQEKRALAEQKRNALVFNKVRRNIKMVTGYERRTRHQLIISPTELTDEATADVLSGAMLWAQRRAKIANVMSDAFEGCLKTGINLVQLGLDFSDDQVNGDLTLDRIPYNAFLLDPRFTKRDLKDCEYILQRKMLSREAIKALLPFRADEIDLIKGAGPDGNFNSMGSSFRSKDTMSYDEMWTRTFVEVDLLIDRETGETREFEKGKVGKERINSLLQAFPALQVIKKQIPTVELTILVEGNVMFHGRDPWNMRDFPHVAVMAFFDPEYTDDTAGNVKGLPGRDDLSPFFSQHRSSNSALKLQSLVRPARDPQTEANKRRSKLLDMIDAQINAGWMAKKGAVSNHKDLYQSGQGKVIWMEDDAQMTDAVKIPSPDIPQGQFAFMGQMDSDVPESMGISEELLGVPEEGAGQMSGALAELRQGAGLTILQDLIDNFRCSQQQVGEKMVKMMQGNWLPSKFQRITNKEPTPDIVNKDIAKYDIVVEESIETPSQKALVYTQLMQAVQMGMPIPFDMIVDYMPIQNKDKLREAIQKQEQQQQQVQQEELEDKARLRELQRSKVFSDIGLGVERIARAEADRGLARERISEMQENNSQAMLSRVKAIKEIEGMETDRLLKLVSFMKSMEENQKQEAQQIQQQQEQRGGQDFDFVSNFVLDKSVTQPGVQQ